MLFWNTMPENLKRLHGVRGKLNCWIAPMAGWICQIQSSHIFTKSLWFVNSWPFEKKMWQPTWDRNWDSQHNMPRQAVLIEVCKFAAPQLPHLAFLTPENWWLEDEFSFGMPSSQVRTVRFGGGGGLLNLKEIDYIDGKYISINVCVENGKNAVQTVLISHNTRCK